MKQWDKKNTYCTVTHIQETSSLSLGPTHIPRELLWDTAQTSAWQQSGNQLYEPKHSLNRGDKTNSVEYNAIEKHTGKVLNGTVCYIMAFGRRAVKSYALSPLIVKGTTGIDSLGAHLQVHCLATHLQIKISYCCCELNWCCIVQPWLVLF
jgi:hypothetical protein